MSTVSAALDGAQLAATSGPALASLVVASLVCFFAGGLWASFRWLLLSLAGFSMVFAGLLVGWW